PPQAGEGEQRPASTWTEPGHAQLAGTLPISLLPPGEGAPKARMRERTCELADDLDRRSPCRIAPAQGAGTVLPAASLIRRSAPRAPEGRRERSEQLRPPQVRRRAAGPACAEGLGGAWSGGWTTRRCKSTPIPAFPRKRGKGNSGSAPADSPASTLP